MKEISEQERYAQLQKCQQAEWEAKCTRCGACCGAAEGDPCEHLAASSTGGYLCNIYEHRFGLRKSVSGREFRCVPIRNILHTSWPGDQCCGYKKAGEI